MSVFLKDLDKVYRYEDLLYRINYSSVYKPCIQTSDLYDFFTNFLLGYKAYKQKNNLYDKVNLHTYKPYRDL